MMDAPSLPSLPPGYIAQPAWGFRDATGRYFYEFNRVYGPPTRSDESRPTTRLDRDLSYWVVTWPTLRGAGDERPAGRWLSLAQARKLLGEGLRFERFSSLVQMRPELPALLDIGENPEEASRANDTSRPLDPSAAWGRA